MTLEFVATAADEGRRLDIVLSQHLPDLSRSQVQRHIQDGRVRVNGRDRRSSWRLTEGSAVWASVPPPPERRVDPEAVDLDFPHVDDHVIVVRKPAGMVVHPTDSSTSGTLVNALLHHFPDLNGVGSDPERPGIVHRLDRDTSGLMMVARTDAAHASLQAQLRDRSATRVYAAIVCGSPPASGTIDAPIGRSTRDRTKYTVGGDRQRDAVTHYEVVQRYGEKFALLDVQLETGRTHQIRVHLTHIGHAVAGDATYGKGDRRAVEDAPPALRPQFAAVGRQLLHARRLAFVHPSSGERVAFDDDLPADMQRIAAALRGANLG